MWLAIATTTKEDHIAKTTSGAMSTCGRTNRMSWLTEEGQEMADLWREAAQCFAALRREELSNGHNERRLDFLQPA